MKELKELFLELVQIDSPSGCEDQMIISAKAWLDKLGFDYKVDNLGNILAYNGGFGEPILLCAHMDTVQPGVGIKPIEENGIIKSGGDTILGADNKASIAAIMTAVEKLEHDCVGKKRKAIELLFTVKEETGGGVEFFPFEWIKSKTGFIFDSSNPLGGIVLTSPYIYNFEVTYSGKSAHASTPEHGSNSLVPAVELLGKIKVGQVSPSTTVNIGKLTSGTGINVIPEKTTIQGEVRSYDQEEFEQLLKQIEEWSLETGSIHKVDVKFQKSGYCSGYIHDECNAVVKHAIQFFSEMGIDCKMFHKSGISDASPLIEAGITMVNLADGVQNPHTTEECIAVDDLYMLERIVTKILEKHEQDNGPVL